MKIINANAMLKIEQVNEWQDNPRSVKQADLERLKNQIKDVGVYKPIIVIKESEKDIYTVIGGNMRLKALTALGYKEIWCCIIEVKDEAEKVKISLSDNDRVGFYNDDELAFQIKDLDINLEDYKVDLKVPDIDLQDILDRNIQSVEGEDNVPEVTETDIKLGDMFQLGRHRLLCGDCTKKEDTDKLIDNNKIQLIITDPPYGVSYSDKNANLNQLDKGNRNQKVIENDMMTESETFDFWYNTFINIKKYLADVSSYYIFSPQIQGMMMMMMMMKAEMPYRHVIIWVKNNHVLGRCDYNYKHEPLLYGWINTHKFYGNGKMKTSVWEVDKPHSSKLHPTMKPVELIANAILNSTQIDENVFDCFMGSGTTLIACEGTGRICFGLEVDPIYCQVIIERWEELTGGKAVKI